MKRTAIPFMPYPGTLERLYGVNVRFASRLASLLGKRARQGAGLRMRNIEHGLKGLRCNGGVCDLGLSSPVDTATCLSQLYGGPHSTVVGAGADVADSASIRITDLLDDLASTSPKGLSPVRSRQRDKAIALIRDEALLNTAAYSFNNVRLERTADAARLRVGDETLTIPVQLPESGELTALSCGACTLGPRLEAKVRQLFGEKRAALALALDYLGNELLQSLSRRLLDQILASVQQHGLSLGQELHVGDPDLDISTQAATLRLAGAGGIGITLHRNNLLLPTKSTSLVFAIGRNLPSVAWTPCERCPSRKRCHARGR
jgi:hypothetical protein